jgi:Ca-activated chloride channel homolog
MEFNFLVHPIRKNIKMKCKQLKLKIMKTNVILLFIIANLLNYCTVARTIQGTVKDEQGVLLSGVSVAIKGSNIITQTDLNGLFSIEASNNDILVFSFLGFDNQEIKVGNQNSINVVLTIGQIAIHDLVLDIVEDDCEISDVAFFKVESMPTFIGRSKKSEAKGAGMMMMYEDDFNTEGYSAIHENGYKKAIKTPLSTFSIDVDAASYSNTRRFLMNGQTPPIDAVRIEEMINYFNYDYPQPTNDHPFSINYELAACPWNSDNLLIHVGLQGEKISMENLPASNIVFLLDVSGSMSADNKLPLLKKSLKLLVQQLRPEDRVAIVVYAGSSGLVLPSTPGNKKAVIINSLERLQSGGSTAGAAGLKLAYKVATENFIEKGNNRIILATDGDFNIGQSSNAEMERLIEKEREKGIFISVLGFGMGNYKDDKMEIIADKGNGNYAYIDNILEAKKVLVNEFGGTLFTIAKDVKIQVEFNPAVVAEYRLIGYENRLLNDEDFEDDKKDAGELGSGHTVTALYEIKLTDDDSKTQNSLKYQNTELNDLAKTGSDIATIKFRYKKPDGQKSILIEEIISNKDIDKSISDNFNFSAAVAGFGMLLRDSEYKGSCDFELVKELAQNAKGKDEEGYRSEFFRLVKLAENLQLGYLGK